MLPRVEDVHEAARRLRPLLRQTPLVPAPALGPGSLLKLETAQPTGSFKVRGACSALTLLAPGERVVAASAGNHALGVAWAAERLGLEATVVCAETASPAKLARLRGFPAVLVLSGTSYDDAERHALELAASGLRYVSAYNDPAVVAGGGTLALELFAEEPGPTLIACPTGGGGLLGGVALAASLRADAMVVAVEAEASRGLSASVAAGRVVEVPVAPTLADGLAGNLEPGSITVELAARYVDDMVAVSEGELEAGMRFLHREHGLVVEGAGAAAVAAALAGKLAGRGGRLVCLVTGGNVEEDTFARVLASGDAIDAP